MMSKLTIIIGRTSRMSIRTLFISFLVVFSASKAFANQESWYWGFDLGWAKPFYSGNVGTSVDALNSTSGISRLGLGGSLGFYWPVGSGETILGITSTGMVDSFSLFGSTLSINQSLLSF